MARFEDAIEFVLKHEGGYTPGIDDPGGETNFGITRRDHPDEDIKNLTIERAKQIYQEKYWLPIYDEISSQAAATKLLDIAVNMGHTVAHRLVQQACEHCPVAIDGSFGPETLQAVNAASEDDLVRQLAVLQAERYARLVLRNPKFKKFLKGWMARAQDLPVNQPAA